MSATETLPSARQKPCTSCGFCEGSHCQLMGRWYDVSKRCKSTCYGAVPALTLAGLVRIIRRKLKKIQYRPHLIDGCLAGTGLKIEPW